MSDMLQKPLRRVKFSFLAKFFIANCYLTPSFDTMTNKNSTKVQRRVKNPAKSSIVEIFAAIVNGKCISRFSNNAFLMTGTNFHFNEKVRHG